MEQLTKYRVDSYRIPKIPKFFFDDPTLWFLKVESSFRSARITSSNAQADIVMSELDPEVLLCVRDLMSINPQPDNLYTQMKERIISNSTVSTEARLRQLIKGDIITDGKPSLILNRLRCLSDNKCNDEVLRTIFLDHLPANHRAILALSNVATLQELAALADKLNDVTQSSCSNVAAITPNSSNQEDIASKLDRVISELAKLSQSRNNESRSRSSTPSRSQKEKFNSRAKSKNRNESELCWYHNKFAEKATKCVSPCAWSVNRSGN